jgi:hypothetical protein
MTSKDRPQKFPKDQISGSEKAGSHIENQPLKCSNFGGRYWDRTSDLFRVKEARSRCANRP